MQLGSQAPRLPLTLCKCFACGLFSPQPLAQPSYCSICNQVVKLQVSLINLCLHQSYKSIQERVAVHVVQRQSTRGPLDKQLNIRRASDEPLDKSYSNYNYISHNGTLAHICEGRLVGSWSAA